VNAIPREGINVSVSRDWIDGWTLWILGLGFILQSLTLWVVWIYTRATQNLLNAAQEQNKHAQKQIELAQEKMRLEEEARIRAAMPLFVWELIRNPHVVGYIEDDVTVKFHNRGGSFVLLETRQTGLTNINVDENFIGNGDEGQIVLGGWPDQRLTGARKIVYFGLRVLTSIGEVREIVFKIEANAECPELESEVLYKNLDNPKKTVGVSEIN